MLTWLNSNPTSGQAVKKENGGVGKMRVSMAHASGVITLGESEVCA